MKCFHTDRSALLYLAVPDETSAAYASSSWLIPARRRYLRTLSASSVVMLTASSATVRRSDESTEGYPAHTYPPEAVAYHRAPCRWMAEVVQRRTPARIGA